MMTSARAAAAFGGQTSKPAAAARSQRRDARGLGHDHFHAAVPQVLRVGMSLAAEADDGDGLAVKKMQIGILFVQHLCELPPIRASSRG